jgi:hypothetical protein
MFFAGLAEGADAFFLQEFLLAKDNRFYRPLGFLSSSYS